MVHRARAVGKCQKQVPYSCAIGIIPANGTCDGSPTGARSIGRKRPPVPEARRPTGSPTVRRRELGALLRSLRTERGLTVEQVAGELLCSPSKVSRLETGQRGATQRDVRDLCDLYGVTDPAEREQLMTLAREGKQQGWWQSFSVPLPHMIYVGLEQEAASLSVFQSGCGSRARANRGLHPGLA